MLFENIVNMFYSKTQSFIELYKPIPEVPSANVDSETCINTITISGRRYLVIDNKYDKLSEILLHHKPKTTADYGSNLSPSYRKDRDKLMCKLEHKLDHHIRRNIVENTLPVFGTLGTPILTFKNNFVTCHRYSTNCIHDINCNSTDHLGKQILTPDDRNYYKYWHRMLIIHLYRITIEFKGLKLNFYDCDYYRSLLPFHTFNYLSYWYSEELMENTVRNRNQLSIDFTIYNEKLREYKDYEHTRRPPTCGTMAIRQNSYFKPKPHDEIHHIVFSDILDRKDYNLSYIQNCWKQVFRDNQHCDLVKLDTYITIPSTKSVNLDNPYFNKTPIPASIQYYPCPCNNHKHPILRPNYNIENSVRKCGNNFSNKRTKTDMSTPESEILRHVVKDSDGNIVFDGSVDPMGKLLVEQQDNRHGYNAIGYKIGRCEFGPCIIKLGLFEDSYVASEGDKPFIFEGKTLVQSNYRSAKFRTNLCVVLGIIPVRFNDLDLNKVCYDEEQGTCKIARSCIYTDNFTYVEGEIIYISDFVLDSTAVCLPGIHFFFDLDVAISMFQYDTIGINDDCRQRIEDCIFYDFQQSEEMSKLCKNLAFQISSDDEAGPSDAKRRKINTSLLDETMHNADNILRLKIVGELQEYKLDEDDICNICYDDLKNKDIIALPCGHFLCLDCIQNSSWIHERQMCPLCRQKIYTNNWPGLLSPEKE